MAESTIALPQFKGRPGWEFTDISGLDLAAYERVAPVVSQGPLASEDSLWQLDSSKPLPDGVIVGPLDEANAQLGSLISADDDVFVALNDAGERGGTFVYVPRGVTVRAPIALNVTVPGTGTLANQRTLIVVEEGAQVEVWEQLLSGDG